MNENNKCNLKIDLPLVLVLGLYWCNLVAFLYQTADPFLCRSAESENFLVVELKTDTR